MVDAVVMRRGAGAGGGGDRNRPKGPAGDPKVLHSP